MPAGFVVDASVVVEFLAPGRFGSAADRLIGGLAWSEPLQLFAPDIILLEVANALRGLAIAKAISEDAASRSITRLPQLSIALVASGRLLEAAWSFRKKMTIYDGAYAGLSKGLDHPLVSTDARLVRACAQTDVDAFRVDQKELGRLLDSLEM